jgi:hypothetical protein
VQHVFGRRVVAKSLTYVNEQIFVSGREHKAAAELQWIFSQAMLFVACRLGATARVDVVSTQQMEQGSVAQPYSFIRKTFVVDQERKLYARLFTKELRVTHVAQANHGKARAFLLELCFEFAQLRYMLSAEDSTIMAQEDQHGRPALPQ